jgi:Tol biopolymer transport system component
MPLDAGTQLGPYAILAQIGAGGMGEVYKATDTRLSRTVAVKVLPSHFSYDPEMKQRFDREARTVAGLNHPHICTLHDIGRERPSPDADPVDFIVMEYLDGETLALRLSRGALPLAEALKVGIQIADALEKAHAQGVTHRDLKPGNVMLTEGGAKLLDFGLAKLRQPTTASSPSSSVTSPVTPSATTPGTILGTMQYMAPEQLEGQEADARTDIFAFGAVLYEMLTGRKAFEGKSQPHLIAAIVSVQPDPISKSVPAVPPVLDFLVQRCLEKDPDHRLQTATDLVHDLRWIAGGGTEGRVPISTRRRRVNVSRVALAAAVLLALVMAGLVFLGPRAVQATEATRFAIDVPDMPIPEAVAISPDGRTVAYSARDAGATAVFVRPLDVDEATRLPGTDGAGRLFWSPDSRWIAFFADGRLKRVEAEGGPAQNVTETPDLIGGSWNADGEILFASSQGLQRVLAAGGQSAPVTLTSEGEPLAQPREPYFLPDGRRFLFLAGSGEDAAIYAAALDSPDATRLVAAESNAAYAEPGHLLYHRQGTLYAQRFDEGGLSLDGEAIRMADGLPVGTTGAAAFSASSAGVLIYRNNAVREAPPPASGGDTGIGPPPPILWVGRDSRTEPAADAARWIGVDLSPDGRRIAAHRHDPDGGDIWVFNVGEQTPTRFTFEAGQDNSMPVWSPDGQRIAFASRRSGTWGLYTKVADNTRAEELVIETELPAVPMSWSPDGNRLVYSMTGSDTAGDIWSVSPGAESAERKGTPLVRTVADERNPQVSPDGRWLAYSSNETGRSEIYIRPFPDGPGRIQVSVDGGVYPRWRRDSRELYFMNLVSFGGMMASEIRVSGSSIQREVPRRLFQTNFASQPHAGGSHHAYAMTADGQRFLIPGFENPVAAFGSPQALGAAVISSIIADRRAASGAASLGAPIIVLVNWPAAAGGQESSR